MNITVLDARYYKDTDPELYEYLSSGNTIKVRCVKVELETGKIEIILTNLETEKFTSDEIKELLEKETFISKCRRKETNYIRKRKIGPQDIILYELNKKGLSSKMEIINFNNINNVKNISSPG